MRKILVITNDLEIGGIQKSLIDFLRYLVGRGDDIDLLLWQKGGTLRGKVPSSVRIIEKEYIKPWRNILLEKKISAKIEFFTTYLRFQFYSKVVKKPWLFYPRIEQHYDIAVSYSQNGYPRFYAIDRVSADKKYLWYHHGSYNLMGGMYELDKKYYGEFDRLITVSSANKQMLIKHFPEYTDKFFIVPNIINVNDIILGSKQEVSDFIKTDDVFTFVTVSRFSREKGIDLAVDVATELKKQGLKFVWLLIGDGDYYQEINKTIKYRGIDDVCILLGSKENPYPYMKLADIYIQPSYVESQSIAVYEALVLKKVIVATNLPALNDALLNGELGVLCNPEIMCFVQKIKSILYDKSVYAKLAEAVGQYSVRNDITYQAIEELS